MKNGRQVFLVCFLIFLFCISASSAQQEPVYKEGELLVKFKPGIGLQIASDKHAKLGSKRKKFFKKTGIYFVKLASGLTVKEAIEIYKKDPDVLYAEPNFIIYALDVFPNDPSFIDLWGLHNTGQTGGKPDADIDAPEAWQVTTGSGNTIVAVIDTGVDYSHQDLYGNMWRNLAELNGVPGVDDDGNGYIDDIYGIDAFNNDTNPWDDHGHGTHCSGTIGAMGNNGIGVVGVNWNVKIMALKFLGGSGYGTDADAIECLEYAIMMKKRYGQNIRITSNSWGGGDYSQALYDAIKAAGDDDILFVAAAGNDKSDNDRQHLYPSAYDLPNIIAVAATDHNDNLASFSNWGLTSVDVAAPGVKILSTVPGNNYVSWSGTSMATPHVSGLAALILAQHPEYSSDQVKWNILLTVDPLISLQDRILTGGRINADNALTCNSNTLHISISNPQPGFEIAANDRMVLKALVGTCSSHTPDSTVTVNFNTGQNTLQLRDDGVYPDRVANDGEYATYWFVQITPGNCDLILTFSASAPGYDSASTTVQGKVKATAKAGFTADKTCILAGSNVHFADQSQGMVLGWLWDFGDGVSSTEQNPVHAYSAPGIYTVSLTITGLCESLTETKVGYIEVHASPVAPRADFIASPTLGNIPLTVDFKDLSRCFVEQWLWDFGDGSPPVQNQNPSHIYLNTGKYTVSLTVTGPGGSDTKTKTDYIEANLPPTIGYSPLSFSFTATEGGPNPPDQSLSIWNAGSGTIHWWLWVLGGCSYVSLNPHGGINSGTVTLSVDIKGWPACKCDLLIDMRAIDDTYAVNLPLTIPVTVTINPAIRLLAPNGGEVIPSGSIYSVRWEAVAEAQRFNLWYLIGDSTWKLIGKDIAGNSYNWTVPVLDKNNNTCRIGVRGYNASGGVLSTDTSDKPFTIEVVKLTAPDGGEILTSGTTYQIRWQTNSTIRPVQSIQIYGSPNEGQAGTWRFLTTVSGNPGYYDWTVPMIGTTKDKCRLGIRLLDSASVPIGQDVGDGNFTIRPAQ